MVIDIKAEIGNRAEVLAGLMAESKLADNAMADMMAMFESTASRMAAAVVAGKIRVAESPCNLIEMNAAVANDLRKSDEGDNDLNEEWALIYNMEAEARRAIEKKLRKQAEQFSSRMQEDQMERRVEQRNLEMKQRQLWIERERKEQDEKAAKKQHVEKVHKDLEEYFENLRDRNDERYNREYGSKHANKIDPKEGSLSFTARGATQSADKKGKRREARKA